MFFSFKFDYAFIITNKNENYKILQIMSASKNKPICLLCVLGLMIILVLSFLMFRPIENTINDETKQEEEYYELITNIVGNGSIEIDPEKDNYTHGNEVNLSAVPADGWKFVNWTGDVPEDDFEKSNITVIMNENKNVTATFKEIEYERSFPIPGYQPFILIVIIISTCSIMYYIIKKRLIKL